MAAVSEQVQAPPAVSRRLGSVMVSRAVPFALATVVAIWLEWARFGMPTPSLIDDWFAIAYSESAFHSLLRGEYASSAVDFAGRYRPAYTGVWNYAQWHLLGSPSVAVAAVWGVLRIVLFLLAVWLLTVRVVGDRASAAGSLLWLAPLAIALTPAIAVDLVRYGPGEPLMVAGLIIGLTLVGIGVRKLLFDAVVRRSRLYGTALIAAGYVLYLFGVYSKEASICLLALIPFVPRWLRASLRTRTSSVAVHWVPGVLGVLLVAPLVHMTARVGLSVSGDHNPYPGADRSFGTRLLDAGLLPFFGTGHVLGTFLWLVVAPVAVAVAARLVRRSDPDASLIVGVLTVGFLMTGFQLAGGERPSRYYIPWIVALAAVALRGLTQMSRRVQVALAVLAIGIAPIATHKTIGNWADNERRGSAAVALARAAIGTGCPVYLANFDRERRVAIPRLLRFADRGALPRCPSDSRRAYVLAPSKESLPTTLIIGCQSRWKTVRAETGLGLSRCDSFTRRDFADQDAASGDPLIRNVRLRIPARAPSPRSLFQPR